MGRIAYGVGLASVSWGAAVLALLGSREFPTRVESSSSVVASALFRHGGTALMVVLPMVVASAVFVPETPRQKHIAALLFVPLAFALALFAEFSLEDCARYGSPFYDLSSLASQLRRLTPIAFTLAALTLPLAPILSFARSGDSDDHDARARRRIGACLAGASVVQIAVVLSFFILASADGIAGEALSALPAVAALFFGLLETVRNHRLLSSLQAWVARVRSGAVPGVRVRAAESSDFALYVPKLVTPAGALDDLEVLEAYPDDHRLERPSALGRVPRR